MVSMPIIYSDQRGLFCAAGAVYGHPWNYSSMLSDTPEPNKARRSDLEEYLTYGWVTYIFRQRTFPDTFGQLLNANPRRRDRRLYFKSLWPLRFFHPIYNFAALPLTLNDGRSTGTSNSSSAVPNAAQQKGGTQMSDFRVHSPALHSRPPNNNKRSEVRSIEASLKTPRWRRRWMYRFRSIFVIIEQDCDELMWTLVMECCMICKDG